MTNNYRLVFRLSSVLLLGGAGLGASGCSATVTVSATTCGQDSTVNCSADPNSTGYSCAGTDFPSDSDPTLVCGDGVEDPDGNIDYCCETSSSTFICNADSTVVCSGGAAGYSCVGGATPDDPTLLCSDGTTDGSNVDFCCISVTTAQSSDCTVDATITCATAGSYGFNCASGSSPTDVNSSLTCSAPTSTSAADLFCCVDGTTTTPPADACNADTTVDCSASGTTGYTCTGTAYPTDTDPTITICSDPTAAGDAQTYCCATTTSAAFGCTNPDSTITCTGSATGVSCLGGATPDSTTLICSIGETDPTTAGQEDYCCITLTTPETGTSTCTPDETVSTCVYPSYGFSCSSSSDDPTSLDPSLNCSAGVADPDGNTDFCCK